MEAIHTDFETTSDLDLNEVGVYRYCEDPSTRILCMSYWLPGEDNPRLWYPGMPLFVREWALAGGGFAAWNDGFERTVWDRIAVPKHGFPRLRQQQWHNVQAIAQQRNFPAGLDGTAKALGLSERKDAEGKRLMMRMAVGKDITPENLQRLGAYCVQDVRTESAADRKLGAHWPAKERAVYLLSEKINDRGILIDREFVALAAKAVADYQAHTAQEMKARFGIKPTEVQQVRQFCADRRVVLDDMRADTVESVLAAPEFYPEDVVEILAMRQKAAGNSPKKFAAMLRAVCSDGRIRGMFSYCGAGQTGRWSGRIVQPHNLPRPTMTYEATLQAMDALRAAGGRWEALGSDPLGTLLNCIRPSLIPGPRRVFTVGDESAIEARVLPWLAGCQGPLDVFRAGGDIYLHAASSIYHRPVTKEDKPERQIGKVATLALGYQGGKNAFVTMGRGYGVHVPEEEAEVIKINWRDAHPEIVKFWWNCQDAAMQATQRPGALFTVGLLKFRHTGSALWVQLPSGRSLCYPRMHLRMTTPKWEMEKPEEERKQKLTLCYYVPAGASMVLDFTYGGKLAENFTQAIARDVLAEAMLRVSDLPVVLHAHDEAVAEGEHVERLNEALTARIEWAPDLPLAAEVKVLQRYWKA
jgi:DNA polymerase